MGVRGKKIGGGNGMLRRLAMELGEIEEAAAELQSGAQIGSEFESNKRAPSGFQGMRGKKSGKCATHKKQQHATISDKKIFCECVTQGRLH